MSEDTQVTGELLIVTKASRISKCHMRSLVIAVGQWKSSL